MSDYLPCNRNESNFVFEKRLYYIHYAQHAIASGVLCAKKSSKRKRTLYFRIKTNENNIIRRLRRRRKDEAANYGIPPENHVFAFNKKSYRHLLTFAQQFLLNSYIYIAICCTFVSIGSTWTGGTSKTLLASSEDQSNFQKHTQRLYQLNWNLI